MAPLGRSEKRHGLVAPAGHRDDIARHRAPLVKRQRDRVVRVNRVDDPVLAGLGLALRDV